MSAVRFRLWAPLPLLVFINKGFRRITRLFYHNSYHNLQLNPLSLARIGGWHMTSGGMSKIMLSYGRGIDDSELVTSLTADARIIWGHLL